MPQSDPLSADAPGRGTEHRRAGEIAAKHGDKVAADRREHPEEARADDDGMPPPPPRPDRRQRERRRG